MNVELLRKVAAVIQEKPKEFDMGDWTTEMDCGTAHCIGGWACVLSDTPVAGFDRAARALDIDIAQADLLFYVTDWPAEFQGVVNTWQPTVEQAVARIEHFISTGGAE